jgi:cytochrome d ubiquinol oxidase subunit II
VTKGRGQSGEPGGRGLDAFWRVPFAPAVGAFVLSSAALACTLFPYVVKDRLTVWGPASSAAALRVVPIGVAAILAYSVPAYRISDGKARELTYG